MKGFYGFAAVLLFQTKLVKTVKIKGCQSRSLTMNDGHERTD
jgi:hypothetical protein